jgi:tRNA(fMet)-specific endonuclease VapC
MPRLRRSACFDPLHARHDNHFRPGPQSARHKAAKRIAQVGEDRICTSIVVAAELHYGCARSGSKRLRDAVEDLLGEIEVLPFDVPADADHGAIRAELEAAGKQIGGKDMLIAAHARATSATIVKYR